MLYLAERLGIIANKVNKVSDKMHSVEHVAEDFRNSEKHYLREENVLFPIPEKHRITEPP